MADGSHDISQLRIERRPRRGRRAGGGPRRGVVVLLVVGVLAVGWFTRGAWAPGLAVGAEPLLGESASSWLEGLADGRPLVRVGRVMLVGAGPPVSGTAANGYVVARKRAALSTDIQGRLVEIAVEEGDRVEAGDLIARLDTSQLLARRARAAAERERAQALVAQAEAQRVGAEAGRLRAEAQAAQAEAGRVRAVAQRAQAEARRIEAGARLASAEARARMAELDVQRLAPLVRDDLEQQAELDRAEAERDAAIGDRDAALALRKAAAADLEAAQADVTVAEAGLDAASAAIEAAVAARDAAMAAHAAARAQVASLGAGVDEIDVMIRKSSVFAPFAGVVVAKNAEVGEVVSAIGATGPGARGAVATIVDFDTLEVQVELNQTSLAVATERAPVVIHLDAWPDEALAGEVRQIWPTANRQKGTVEVRIVFLERDPRVLPEMGVRVVFVEQPEVATRGEGEVRVPSSAIVEGDSPSVFLLRDGHVERRFVELSGQPVGRDGAQRVVATGLEGNEIVVLDPPSGLADGMEVRNREQS